MRILICTTEYPPTFSSGIGNVAYSVVEQLKNHGVECTICSPLNADIKLGNFRLIQYFGIAGLLHYWYIVSKYFKKSSYDMVWLHNPLFLFKNPFKKCLVTIHSTYYCAEQKKVRPRIYYFFAAVVEKYCFKKIQNNTISCVSNQIFHELTSIGLNKKNIIPVLNGVDIQKFSISKNSNIRDELGLKKDPVLLYVGRLASHKFVDIVIKSMPRIIEQFPASRLLIVGDGPQKNYLVSLSRKLMLDNSVIFCGLQPTDKVPEYFASADIVICPYSGLVLFEAMACGKPIVAFDVEWHSEVIKNLENGILVENMSSNAISLAVIKLLRDPEFRKNIGMHAHEFAIQFLDWKIIAIKYLNISQEILKKDN